MQVLVLNMDYSPINVTTLKKGFKLVFKGKAEVINHVKEKPIVTHRKSYNRPTVIRLLRYVYLPFKKAQLTRVNIYKRDDHKCLYCGGDNKLTLDHVIPKSRGGGNTWENLATCCSRCNVIKGNKTPEEAGMGLRVKPFKPSYLYFVEKVQNLNPDWKIFVGGKMD